MNFGWCSRLLWGASVNVQVTKSTVEEKVLQIHGDKRALAGDLLEGSGAVAKLDMKELLALI